MPEHHCYVTSDWLARWPQMTPDEQRRAKETADSCGTCKVMLQNAIEMLGALESLRVCQKCCIEGSYAWNAVAEAGWGLGLCPRRLEVLAKTCEKTDTLIAKPIVDAAILRIYHLID